MPTIGAYYPGFKADERVQRLRDIPILADTGFDRLASAFSAADANCLKAAQLCRDRGMKVLLQPNALTPAEFTSVGYAALPNVDWIDIWDDAHSVSDLSLITKKRDAWAAVIGPNRLTSITCAKNADQKYLPICPVYCGQYYTWKEANWLKVIWDDVRRLSAASLTGKVVATLWLGKNAVPYTLRNTPGWRVEDREYTPVYQQECAMWLALCAGASDLLFYTAYEMPEYGGLAFPSGASYILDQPHWLAQYRAVFAFLREQDKFLAGKREILPADGAKVGAKWTLPDGSGLAVTIDLKTEIYPRPRFEWFPPPAPPPKPAELTVKLVSDGKTISLNTLP